MEIEGMWGSILLIWSDYPSLQAKKTSSSSSIPLECLKLSFWRIIGGCRAVLLLLGFIRRKIAPMQCWGIRIQLVSDGFKYIQDNLLVFISVPYCFHNTLCATLLCSIIQVLYQLDWILLEDMATFLKIWMFFGSRPRTTDEMKSLSRYLDIWMPVIPYKYIGNMPTIVTTI